MFRENNLSLRPGVRYLEQKGKDGGNRGIWDKFLHCCMKEIRLVHSLGISIKVKVGFAVILLIKAR